MKIEHFLEIFFNKNILIVEVLFGTVLVGLIFLTYRSFTKPEAPEGSLDLSGIEESLKKILQSGGIPNSAVSKVRTGENKEGADLSGEQAMEVMAEIERLKTELSEKSSEVESLKVQLDEAAANATGGARMSEASGASAGGDASQTQVLQEKVKDLEAKLSEYAIIEDDIADLSFYKEETARLQNEVDSLKARLAEYEATGAPAPQATGAASKSVEAPSRVNQSEAPSPTAAPTAPSPAAAPTPTPAEAAPIEASLEAPVSVSAPVTDPENLSASSSAANETIPAEKTASEISSGAATMTPDSGETSGAPQSAAPTASGAPSPAAAPSPTSAKDEPLPFVPADSMEVDDDIMAEFERAVAEQKVASASAKVVKNIPAEAVNSGESGAPSPETAEIASAPSPEAAPSPGEEGNPSAINLDKMVSEAESLPTTPVEEVVNPLEAGLNADKLLEEASGMSKLDTEAINEFDQFLKKQGA